MDMHLDLVVQYMGFQNCHHRMYLLDIDRLP